MPNNDTAPRAQQPHSPIAGVDSVRRIASAGARKIDPSAIPRDLGHVVARHSILPASAKIATVGRPSGARAQGALFREVLPPRCTPPPPLREPSRAIDTVLLVIVCGCASLVLARLLEVFA